MPRNQLPALKIPTAPRGSKKDWPTWIGQVPPAVHEDLLAILGPRHRGDLVNEALTEYAKKRTRKAA